MAEHFPLVVWQTGSGTRPHEHEQRSASRANEMLGVAGDKADPSNDQVNYGQSRTDSFPTAMHIAAVQQINRGRVAGAGISAALEEKSKNRQIIKIGRTHPAGRDP